MSLPRITVVIAKPGEQNHCQCGCGEPIAWKTKAGLPRQYKNIQHLGRARAKRYDAARREHLDPATAKWTTADVALLTPETIHLIPDNFLYGLLRRTRAGGNRHLGDAFVKMICAEARSRGMKQAAWLVNMLEPPPCQCGKPGHYIVGDTTYCREHAMIDGAKRRDAVGQLCDARRAAIMAAFDRKLRGLDSARKHHQARGKK